MLEKNSVCAKSATQPYLVCIIFRTTLLMKLMHILCTKDKPVYVFEPTGSTRGQPYGNFRYIFQQVPSLHCCQLYRQVLLGTVTAYQTNTP